MTPFLRAGLAGAALSLSSGPALAATQEIVQSVRDSINFSRTEPAGFILLFDSGFNFRPFDTSLGTLTSVIYDFDFTKQRFKNVTATLVSTLGGETLNTREVDQGDTLFEVTESAGFVRLDLLNDFIFGTVFDAGDFTSGPVNVEFNLRLGPFSPEPGQERIFEIDTLERLIYTYEPFVVSDPDDPDPDPDPDLAPIPLPAGLPLLLAGLGGLAMLRRRKTA
jgi:hypothetical protein